MRQAKNRTGSAHCLGFPALAGVLAVSCLTTVAHAAALLDAARAGDWDEVSRLIETDSDSFDLDQPAPDGTTALMWAVHSRQHDVVEALARSGADLDAANRYGETPLSLAARDGNADLLELLLEAGADAAVANYHLPEGQTLAMLAARRGSVEALQALSSHGAIEVDSTEERTETTALMWAAIDNRGDAIRYLASLGADPDLRSKVTDYPHLGNGVLLTGVEEGVSYVGQTPLQRGGWTALMYAARSGATEAVKALADAGANLDAQDPLGESALTLAIINGHWPVVDVLLDAGADPKVADNAGSTPLYAAVDFHSLPATYGRPAPKPRVVAGSVAAAARLLEAGADVDAALVGAPLRRQYTGGDGRLRQGATPLMRAAATADLVMMQLLLEAGADARARPESGNSAILLAAAAAKGDPDSPEYIPVEQAIDAVDLSLRYGSDIQAVDARGRTAAHLAATKPGAAQMIEFLASRGASVDAEDESGETPLDLVLAADAPDEATIQTLRRLSGAQ